MVVKYLDRRPEWAKRIGDNDVSPGDTVYTSEEIWQGVQKRMRQQRPRKKYFRLVVPAIIAIVGAVYLLRKKKSS